MMKKSYKIAVDCANCANLIEHAVGQIEGVQQASVSFIMQKMKIVFDDDADVESVIAEIAKTGRKIEQGFEIL